MNTNDEPSAGDYAKVAVLIIGCAASITVCFALLAVGHMVSNLNPLKKRSQNK